MDTHEGKKPFWRTCKPYFSNKHGRGLLVQYWLKKKLIFHNMEMPIAFHYYFTEIVLSLNLFKWPENVTSLVNDHMKIIKYNKLLWFFDTAWLIIYSIDQQVSCVTKNTLALWFIMYV